jgi:hypothetical protein
MSDTDVTVHWNKDTQGTGPFRRRDIVEVTSLRQDRINLGWYMKRLGQRGEVSAVYDNSDMCSVLFEDGYWIDLHFDEIKNTGEKGSRFYELYVIPCPAWD